MKSLCRPATSFASVRRQHPSVVRLREAFTELLCNCLDLLRTDRLATVDTSCCTDDTNNNGTIDRDELAGLLKALNLEKYVPSAEELEAKSGPLPKLPDVDPVEAAAAAAAKATNEEEAVVEGALKQLVVEGSASKRLAGLAQSGLGAIAGTEVPQILGGTKKKESTGSWVDRQAKLTTNTFTWSTGSFGSTFSVNPMRQDEQGAPDARAEAAGSIDLADIKRVAPTSAADGTGGYAFEVGARAHCDGRYIHLSLLGTRSCCGSW